jgi:hypothetical protein
MIGHVTSGSWCDGQVNGGTGASTLADLVATRLETVDEELLALSGAHEKRRDIAPATV